METSNHQKPGASAYRTTGLKVLSVLGFIIVLVFGAWGIIQVARSLPSVGSSLSSAAAAITSLFMPDEKLGFSLASANITSGQPFTLSWVHEPKRGSGTYTVSFECRDGLSMQTVGANGVYQSVLCATPLNFDNTTTEVTLIPNTIGARFLDVPFKVAYTELASGKVTVSAETTLTITNNSVGDGTSTPTTPTPTTPQPTTPAPTTPTPTTPTPTTPKPVQPTAGEPRTYTYTTVGRASNPNGNPDLAVTILEAGSGQYNSGYYSGGVIRKGERGIVRFVVENVGTKTTDNWTFNAVLPTMPMYIYSSDVQPALGPGDKIQFSLGFDKADASATQGALTVTVDPNNAIWNELSENNNTAKVYLTIIN